MANREQGMENRIGFVCYVVYTMRFVPRLLQISFSLPCSFYLRLQGKLENLGPGKLALSS
jgi:hypothetical protein